MSNSFSFDKERYSRQIILPGIGEEGQEKLSKAKVLIVGAGGLGSPVALYLAAAGIGRIGLVDSDKVEVSNLQRQLLYADADIGRPKSLAASEKLKLFNPTVEVVAYDLRLAAENAMATIRDYDIVIDGSDNFPTRYLVNDACVLAKKTLIHGAFLQFEGQATVINPYQSPCYRCLFPEPPPPGAVPSCREAGVLGALAGVIGSIMAAETLKVILGIGDILTGSLLVFNALEMNFRKIGFPRKTDCPVCGDNPSVRELVDYELFCRG